MVDQRGRQSAPRDSRDRRLIREFSLRREEEGGIEQFLVENIG